MRKLRNDGRPIRIESRLGELDLRLRGFPGVAAAFLFGSYGTPYQTPLSDVDVAVLFRADAVPAPGAEAAVMEALAEDDVSLTVLNRVPSVFALRVLRYGRLLPCTDATSLADFTAEVLQRQADFAIPRERFLREYDAALHERFHAAWRAARPRQAARASGASQGFRCAQAARRPLRRLPNVPCTARAAVRGSPRGHTGEPRVHGWPSAPPR